MGFAQRRVGRYLARWINSPIKGYEPVSVVDLDKIVLRKADVVLVEGNLRVSTAIKYLTQSTWSHAAIYVGHGDLVEADVELGVIRVPVEKYSKYNIRICRPVGLSNDSREAVCRYVVSHLGNQYDLKNIVDLARYLWPMPLVPTKWRRSMIALGSGDPTKAICSTLIANAFQEVKFEILPPPPQSSLRGASTSYIVPRDFDISPFFEIIKPIPQE